MMGVLRRLLELFARDSDLDKCPQCGEYTGLRAGYCRDCIEENRQKLYE